MKFLLTFIVLIAILMSVVSAHHSVRTKKPATEEERLAHHLLHRRQPRKELKNDLSIKDENAWKGYKSKSYHFKVGPEYPDHSKRRQDYKRGGESSIPMGNREAEAYRRKTNNQ